MYQIILKKFTMMQTYQARQPNLLQSNLNNICNVSIGAASEYKLPDRHTSLDIGMF